MKFKFIGIALFSFFIANSQSDSLQKLYSGAVEKQSAEMAMFFKKKNYKDFANYTHPEVIKLIGTKSKMIEVTENALKKMEGDGYEIIDVSVESPSQFLKEGVEIQCVLIQTIITNTPQGKIKSKTSLIGVSQNDGGNWFFVDSKGKEIEILRKTIPSLSSKLNIPKKENPEFIND